MRALGIDLASSFWAANGSALVEFSPLRFERAACGAIRWPSAPLSARALAEAIDDHARSQGATAVALDGPQGWRDPASSAPGVGRSCERACRTQGKTGVWPKTYPGTQRAFFEFCIEVFAELAGKPYAVLEVFPTSAWRSSGLRPLPAKGKRPPLAPYVRALREAYALPPVRVISHDDLQALVAAVAGAAFAGGPAVAVRHGIEPTLDAGGRCLEGFIWDVAPRAAGG